MEEGEVEDEVVQEETGEGGDGEDGYCCVDVGLGEGEGGGFCCGGGDVHGGGNSVIVWFEVGLGAM